MSQYQEKAKITRFEQLTDQMVRITFYSPEIAAKTRPGQFVMIKAGKGKDPLLRRPFSVHQTTNDGHLQVLFKVVGRGTDMLGRRKEGETLSIFGPLGNGYSIKKDKPACIVAGGLGIAPMLLLAKKISRSKIDTSNDVIILGGRTGEEIKHLIDDFKQFGIKVLPATDDGSFGHHGFVTDVLKAHDTAPETVVYTCGPEPMMHAVKNICEEKGITCQVSVESVMACGMGACLGCTIHDKDENYVHVCLNGPVFKAEDLKWNL